MIKKVFIVVLCVFGFSILKSQDSLKTFLIDEITVLSDIKTYKSLDTLPFLSNSFNQQYLNQHNVTDFKYFSTVIPSLYIADYGSNITSSIYMRGIGSRIDNSSVGIGIDGIMLLNKNCFDFDYFDFSNIDILRGSQSLLYGMNAMAGVININTLSPFDYQGLKFNAEYSSANTMKAKLSFYKKISDKKAFMIGTNATKTDGFFRNEYNKENVDWSKTFNGRFIFEYKKNEDFKIKNSSFISAIHQGGYAYRRIDTNTFETEKVNYNDFSGYDRFNFINNTSILKREKNKYVFQSLTSLQLNFDKMVLDNDFTQEDYFTLEQKQQDYSLSQEFIVKNDRKNSSWDWTMGTFFFCKYLNMQAPVLFKQTGIQRLILDNINNGMHSVFPQQDVMLFKDDTMLVDNKFKYPRIGGAVYLQSSYKINKRTKIVAGLRFDVERVGLDYESFANVDYLFTGTMTDYAHLYTSLEDNTHKYNSAFLPKISLLYKIKNGNLFASISRGYMTGGYNTQMFADLLQQQMMQDMLKNMGLTPVPGSVMSDIYASYDKNEVINYKPQYMWDYEIGTHLSFLSGRLQTDASLFYMNIQNQQITIFLTPYTNGRMMDNVASSISMGGEFSVSAKIKRLTLVANYGYTRAKFKDYNDNKDNYKNKYLPYYPLNTVSLSANYVWIINSEYIDNINFFATYSGMGKIYFNQTNTLYQKYYNTLNFDIVVRRNQYSLSFFAKNILNTKYNTFYFLSTGRNFVQQGKPIQFGIKFSYTM
ncbi:MAG: TonB-dependent receptor [Bacteroidales bacterium]|nr:TonB-dependent receptor [Bacteroidales bacterium]